MKIVDYRSNNTDLVPFEKLHHFMIFEIPGENGLFIKYDVPGCVIDVRVGCAGINPNTFRITDSSALAGPLFLKLMPDLLVRPLDTELHIKGVRNYD